MVDKVTWGKIEIVYFAENIVRIWQTRKIDFLDKKITFTKTIFEK